MLEKLRLKNCARRAQRASPEAQAVGAEEARHHHAEAEPVGPRLLEPVAQRGAQVLGVALLLAALAGQGGDGADARDGLLGDAAGRAVGALAHAGELGEVLGHPAAGAGDEGQRADHEERLLPALREADDDAGDEGGGVLHEDHAAAAARRRPGGPAKARGGMAEAKSGKARESKVECVMM